MTPDEKRALDSLDAALEQAWKALEPLTGGIRPEEGSALEAARNARHHVGLAQENAALARLRLRREE